MNNDGLSEEILPDSVESGNSTMDIDSIIDSSLYSEQLDTIILNQEKHYTMMAQNNINQLFVIGAFSGIIVLVLLYSAIKKFI